MTSKDNITISETKSLLKDTVIDDVLNKSGVDDMCICPDGFNTILSKEFNGVDLSGGEWQKVAVARGVYRTHDIIILNEPTAAIDYIEESNIYNRFAKCTENKTAIIVTHRIGSVKLSDRIIILNNVELVEYGPHRYLLSLNGYYARMFKEQEQWYK